MKIKRLLRLLLLGPVLPIIGAGTPDNVEDEIKFGNTVVQVDNEIVSKVTSFNTKTDVSEEEITGSEDVVAGTNVLFSKFTAIKVGKTADMEGIAIESSSAGRDDGQSELQDAVDTGKLVTVRCTRNTGYGWLLSGFFTSYEEGADTSGVYKWKASFRVNQKTEITPGS